MPASPPDGFAEPPGAPPDSRLPARMFKARLLGHGLSGLAVGAALWQAGTLWLLPLGLVQCLVWPWAAQALCRHGGLKAEQRNLLIDAVSGGFWAAAIGFNLLPGAVLLSVLALNLAAFGGSRLLGRGLAAQAAGLGLGALLLRPTFQMLADATTSLACLPLLCTFPVMVGLVAYRNTQRVNQQRQALAASERLYRQTLDAMNAGVAVYDADDRLLLANRGFRATFGPLGPLLEQHPTFEQMLRAMAEHGLLPPDRKGHEEAWVQERLALRRHGNLVQHRPMQDGKWRRVVETVLPHGGRLTFSIDITEVEQATAQRDAYAEELRQLNARLERLSATDELTGLANRRQLDRRLQAEWDRAQRHHLPLALLMVDVDHFKQFNDFNGHLEGDRCLAQVASALAGCARRAGDLAARYGGEEFALLLPHATLDEAMDVAQRCVAAVDALALPSSPGSPRHVTVSVGVASTCTGALGSARALLRAADNALYRAKDQGRHRAVPAAAQDQQPTIA